MDITTFNLSNPWRTGRKWDIPNIERDDAKKIARWLDEPEILILSGARQVGKTSILYQLIDLLLSTGRATPADIYFFNLDLDGISPFLRDQAGFLRFLDAGSGHKQYVFIDEVQRLPDPGILIKSLQDLRLPLKFILTGSSSLDIRKKTNEALTGRKQIFNIGPLSFAEYIKTLPGLSSLPALDQTNYSTYLGALNDALQKYAFYGGYPALLLSDDHEKKILRLNEIFSSYLEKDIGGFLKVNKLNAFRNLVTLLASQQGGLINIQELATTLGLQRDTVARYIYLLEQTFVLKRMTPFFSNPRTELSKMPKIYFIDAGLRNLAIGAMSNELQMRTDIGQTMEGLVASYILNNKGISQKVNFWRTKSGAEVDFVISEVNPIQSLEVKSGTLNQLKISRGYRSFLNKYSPQKAVLLNSNLWSTTEIEGCTVEAIPTSLFLLQTT